PEIELALVKLWRATGNERAAGLANHLEEVDDEPVADLESAIEIAALERELRELRAVESARKRLHEPDFGLCQDCEADIPYARLSANPTAIRCIGCQTRHERGAGPAPRL
ncbi:MAG: TraR/DksA family transcriptional regulator, partial [Chloroflexota bacterium]